MSVLYRTRCLHIRGLTWLADGETFVAFTGHCLKHLPVSDAQIPALVTDRSRGLHVHGHHCNACAPHSEVVGNSLLGNLNHGLFYAIGNQQQPDRKSLFHQVKNGAGGALANLPDVIGGVI